MKQFDIEKIVKDRTNLYLSKSYDKYDNVERISIRKTENGITIESYVDVLGDETASYIYLDQNEEIESYQCQCIWCKENSPCAHIGATLLKMNALQIDSLPFRYQSRKMEQFEEEKRRRILQKRKALLENETRYSRELIQRNKDIYSRQLMSLLQNEKYEIEPIINLRGNSINIEYKIGNEKKYIIKDIDDFLGRIDNNDNHSYGKYLSFVHNPDAFDEFALKQIDFMRAAKRNLEEYMKENYYYSSKAYLGRSIRLSTGIIDVFFEAYQNYEFSNCSLKDLDFKIPLKILEDEETYTIHLNLDDRFEYGEKNIYFIKETKNRIKIQRVALDEDGEVLSLLIELLEDDIRIMKENYPEFHKYVLLSLLDYFDIQNPVNIDENAFNIIRIYGDVNDDSEIYFKIYYIDENNNRILGFNQDIITNYQQDVVENYISQYATHIDEDKHIAYLDLNDEKTYEFINEGLDFLSEYAEIYVSEALKKLGKTAHYSITVGVKIEHNLLALDIESAEIPRGEISKVLEQYKRKKKFYRLKNGELLYLNSPQLEELEQFIEDYQVDFQDMVNGHIELSKNRMFSLDQDAQNLEYIQLDRKDSFQKSLDHFKQSSSNHYAIPYQYENILRDYQKDGFVWLRTLNTYDFNGILADDMGLGKTLQVIALIESLHSKRPSLVVCPASLIYNWEDEVHKFSQSLQVKCITGNSQTRSQMIKDAKQYQLLVTSYDYMRRDYQLYEDITFNYVILDEAQYIKNHKTKNAISVKTLKAKHKLALTGTPIENTLAELWSIFDFLMPKYLYNYHYFKKHFENDIVKNYNSEKTKQLQQMVSPFILRRNKKDVLRELPDKIEKTQIIPFNEEENKLYYATLAQVNEELQTIFKMEKVDQIAILALLTRLRQICCEPRLLYENIENISSKMKACIDLIINFKSNQQKVLLFSSFTTVLDLIADELNANHITFYRITGDTPKEDRRKYVEGFQKGEVDVFLISLKAGGTGLNLTAAQAVIHYDPWWNISAQNQATDRAYRIGQEKNVLVYKLVMKDSIEEKIIALQEKKKELADVFVENNYGNLANMTKEEILELFS